MKRAGWFIVLGCVVAVPGWAGIIVQANPAVLSMGAGSISGPMVFEAFNDGIPESIRGWELELVAIPDAGATGTLIFNSAGEPSPYVFDGMTHSGIVFYSGGDPGSTVLKAVDAASVPVPIPAAPAVNLLRVDYAASADAGGSFGIFATPLTGNFGSLWIDPNFDKQPFANVGSGADPIRLATVEVQRIPGVVPEPSTWTLFGLGALGLIAWRRRRQA